MSPARKKRAAKASRAPARSTRTTRCSLSRRRRRAASLRRLRAAPATPPAAAGADKPADPAAPGATPKTEAEWKKRIADERDALSRAQTFAEALQSRINVLSADFVNVDDPAKRDVVAADRQKALAELDRVKPEIQAHQKEITDIQTEARKAGVPAGWVRKIFEDLRFELKS